MVSENFKSIFKSGADTTRSLINIGSKVHHVLWIPFNLVPVSAQGVL